MTRPITDDLRKRFADEQGYLWCSGCDKQLPATLFCESCNDYAWNNDIARTLAKKDMAVLDWCAETILNLEARRNEDGSYGVAA